MDINILMVAGSAFTGAAVAVWGVFHVMVTGIKEDMIEVKSSLKYAHRRMDNHIEKHAG